MTFCLIKWKVHAVTEWRLIYVVIITIKTCQWFIKSSFKGFWENWSRMKKFLTFISLFNWVCSDLLNWWKLNDKSWKFRKFSSTWNNSIEFCQKIKLRSLQSLQWKHSEQRNSINSHSKPHSRRTKQPRICFWFYCLYHWSNLVTKNEPPMTTSH